MNPLARTLTRIMGIITGTRSVRKDAAPLSHIPHQTRLPPPMPSHPLHAAGDADGAYDEENDTSPPDAGPHAAFDAQVWCAYRVGLEPIRDLHPPYPRSRLCSRFPAPHPSSPSHNSSGTLAESAATTTVPTSPKMQYRPSQNDSSAYSSGSRGMNASTSKPYAVVERAGGWDVVPNGAAYGVHGSRCGSHGKTLLPRRTLCLCRLRWTRARAKPALRTRRRRRRGGGGCGSRVHGCGEPPPQVSLAPPPSPPPPRFRSSLAPQLSGALSPSTDFARLSFMSPYQGAAGPRPAWFPVGVGGRADEEVLQHDGDAGIRREVEERRKEDADCGRGCGRGCGWRSFCGRSHRRFSI
ncbi:hypothetical protein MVEN_02570800 [Mycena venus]|uniref:Uncharacterized protein n=1 Tax=Mycena venus TaxID=2733690 RepID=A0A8H6U3R6_9AGAR|nr:hypothetical protein MVEN_02570800 [Mycena venus]